MSPIEVLAAELRHRRIPFASLEGGSLELHITFDVSVTAEQRQEAFEVISRWPWAWEVRPCRRSCP